MLESIFWAALEWTVEYQNFGWNYSTLSAVLMLLFTVLETWGIIQQGKTIWEKESAESVETELFLYTFWFFLLCGIYGFYLHSMAMIINCFVTAVAQIPILRGIIRFRGLTERERIVGSAYALMPVIEAGATYWGAVYMFFAIGLWGAFIQQFLKLRRSGKTGAVDISLYVSFYISTGVWVAYAFQTNETFFKIAMSGGGIIITAIIVQWSWLRMFEPNPPRILQFVRRVLP